MGHLYFWWQVLMFGLDAVRRWVCSPVSVVGLHIASAYTTA